MEIDAIHHPKNTITVRRPYIDNKGRNKTRLITAYYSGGMGSKIVDATTGAETQHQIGTKSEHLYFKVSYVANHAKNIQNVPVTLYYNSPNEYEQHLCEELDEPIKHVWSDKYYAMYTDVNNLNSIEEQSEEFVIIK